MKLEFDKLVIGNFQNLGRDKPAVLRFRDLGPGLHYIQGVNKERPRMGANGVSKSTIWNALCWCLYGRSPAGLRNTDIAPWTGEKPTGVMLHLRVDGKPYLIMRMANPNKLTLDKEVAGQEDIEALVGMNFDLFTNAVLWAQGRPLFLDRTPGDKMELFDAALNLDQWLRLSKIAEYEASSLDADIDDMQGALDTLDALIDRLARERDELKVESDALEEQRAARIAAENKRLQEVVHELDAATRERDEGKLALDSAGVKIDELDAEVARLCQDLETVSVEINKRSNKVRHLEADIARFEQAIATKDGYCPACGRTMDERHRQTLRSRLGQARRQQDAAVPQKVAERGEGLADTIASYRAQCEEHQRAADAARQTIDYYSPRVGELTGERNAIMKQIEWLRGNDNPYSRQIIEKTRERNGSIANAKDIRRELEPIKRKAAEVRFWVQGFKDVRLFVLGDILDQLEWTTIGLMEEVGLEGWSIGYDVERETQKGTVQRGLTAFIQSPDNDKPVKFENWSGGEGQRLRLVGAMALADVLLSAAGIEIDLEIFDEPSRSLSDEGVVDLIETLADRANRHGKQIFLTEHMAVESSLFASTITVIRTKGGSSINGQSIP